MNARLFLFLLPGISLAAPQTFPAENGLTRSLVAREPLLKNPVAVSVDADGTIYATETTRRKVADLDIREFPQWIHDDLSHASIEEKLAFYQRELKPGRFDKHPSLKDHNKDGVVDIRDLTVFSEKIIRFQDHDSDGVMDASNTFAEGFNTEITGIAAGVFAWRGDVFATIAPDLWKLRDTDHDGEADQRESLARGFGIHIAYAGHDMHGVTWGPDGRLYWSIGDKGTNVVSKEGKRWFAPHEGAVLRCYPDGSGFEIFARGLRNCQQIAFDDHGNLFGVDNDADLKGERERFVYITPDSDSGWRCYYQYRKSDYNPWMAESISVPAGPDQPAYITPPLASYSDGPSGFAYNPGTALNDRYQGSFFVSEFPKGDLRSFKTKENGAAFQMTGEHVVMSGPMNVGMNFGPDGALYLADWAGGYALKEKGAIWKLDDLTKSNNEARQQVAAFLKQGGAQVPAAELLTRLSHPDQRIRRDAQWELAKRNALPELRSVAENPASSQLAVIHSIWGLAQTKTFDPEIFALLIKSNDAELRAQAAKWAGEISKTPQPALGLLLTDSSMRARAFAANAIGRLGMMDQLDAVIAMLAENANRDAYLRQAGVLALSGMDVESVAAKTLAHSSAAVRLAAAVVFRRGSSIHAAKLLTDGDPAVVAEAARSIYDFPTIPAAFPDLARLLDSNPAASASAIRRSIGANRKLADSASASRLIQLASNKSVATSLRVAALEALASWTEKIDLDPVDGRWHPIDAADPLLAKATFEKNSATLQLDPIDAVVVAAATAAQALGISADPAELMREATDFSARPAARIRALKLLKAADPAKFNNTALSSLKSESPELRAAAASLLAKNQSEVVLNYVRETIATSKNQAERQQSVELLAALRENSRAQKILSDLIAKSMASPDYPILLELLDAAETVENPAGAKLAGKLGNFASLEGGDAKRGAAVFNENLAAQCIACHRLGPEGSNVGPPLTDIGKKGRDYILESLVNPGAKLAPGFGLMTAILKDGKAVSGAMKEETADSLSLTLPDGSLQKIAVSKIASRSDPVSVMPPMGGILTRREIRDLVEYLTTLK